MSNQHFLCLWSTRLSCCLHILYISGLCIEKYNLVLYTCFIESLCLINSLQYHLYFLIGVIHKHKPRRQSWKGEGGFVKYLIINKPFRVNMSEKLSTWFVYGPINLFHYLSISYFSSWYAKTFPLPYLNRVNNLIETIAKVPNEVLVLLVVLEESFDFACKNKWKMMDLWSKQDESGGNEIIQ